MPAFPRNAHHILRTRRASSVIRSGVHGGSQTRLTLTVPTPGTLATAFSTMVGSSPAAGQFGNTGRNYFVGPHYFEVDASMLKRVAVTERIHLEFRGDATNLTNSPSFAAPTTDITSSIFGRINNSLSSSSRKIQLGAKIHF